VPPCRATVLGRFDTLGCDGEFGCGKIWSPQLEGGVCLGAGDQVRKAGRGEGRSRRAPVPHITIAFCQVRLLGWYQISDPSRYPRGNRRRCLRMRSCNGRVFQWPWAGAHGSERAWRTHHPRVVRDLPDWETPADSSVPESPTFRRSRHRVPHCASSSSKALASCRTGVSKPSVNQP
jgi:hypothetical protein